MEQPIAQAVTFLTQAKPQADAPPPAAASLVAALLQAERQARQARTTIPLAALVGQWRLGFITGTVRSRQRAGVVLGAGRFIPRWLSIQLAYAQAPGQENQGTVHNTVRLGPLSLTLTGPMQFYPQNRILAFDFTRLKLQVGAATLYDGAVRGGHDQEARFFQQPLSDKAFFSYFLADSNRIAARGRGGGLALWIRQEDR
jgi:hypothetical protein